MVKYARREIKIAKKKKVTFYAGENFKFKKKGEKMNGIFFLVKSRCEGDLFFTWGFFKVNETKGKKKLQKSGMKRAILIIYF